MSLNRIIHGTYSPGCRMLRNYKVFPSITLKPGQVTNVQILQRGVRNRAKQAAITEVSKKSADVTVGKKGTEYLLILRWIFP